MFISYKNKRIKIEQKFKKFELFSNTLQKESSSYRNYTELGNFRKSEFYVPWNVSLSYFDIWSRNLDMD
jgi:hypothetical protein